MTEEEIIVHLFERYKKTIVYCDAILWVKDDINIWRCDNETVNNILFRYCCQEGFSLLKADKFSKALRRLASYYCRNEEFIPF